MSRLIFLFAIVALVYLLVRSYRNNASGNSAQDKAIAEDMVRCAQCGVHLPKGESVQVGEHYFCGTEHRDAYRK